MQFETLELTIDERGVAELALNRPDRHNAINAAMIEDLRRAAELLGDDHRVRVVVLSGNGKSFCAGGDFKWFAGNVDLDRAGRVAQGRALAEMLRDLNALPKPLIGRVNGSAYGGGTGMISVCDLAIGAAGARFGLTEVRLGLIPATISPYVVNRIGRANARATMLSGALFDAARAREIGLLTEVVDGGQLETCIEEVVVEHLQAAPGAVAATKRLIDYVSTHDLEENLAWTAERLADAWETEEGRAGIDAFLSKTTPPWRRDDGSSKS
jgi:methylglutaconyl-CoA hydratase